MDLDDLSFKKVTGHSHEFGEFLREVEQLPDYDTKIFAVEKAITEYAYFYWRDLERERKIKESRDIPTPPGSASYYLGYRVSPRTEDNASPISYPITERKEGLDQLLARYENLRVLELKRSGVSEEKEDPSVSSIEKENADDKANNKDLRRRVLAMRYLLSEVGVSFDPEDKLIANAGRLTAYVMSEPFDTPQNSHIYKCLRRPYKAADKDVIDDLNFVETFFKSLGLNRIVEQIGRDKKL